MNQKYYVKHIYGILIIFCLIGLINADIFACNTTGTSGCTSCTDSTYKIIYNNDTQLYTCSNNSNCITVTGNLTSSQCIQCQDNYFLFNSICYLKNITNCLTYTVDASNVTSCTACIYPFMNLTNSCKVDATYCQNYDQLANKCISCPTGKYLDTTTGQYCVSQISNCLVVSYSGCVQCQQQYVIDTVNQNTCKFLSQIAYQISSTNTICLQVNFYYDSTQTNCVQNTGIAVNYCKQTTTAGGTNCSQCIQGYFLKTDGSCQSCSNTVSNCLTCLPCTSPATCSATCTTCLSTYFLFTDPITQGQICRPCTTYGCKRCQISSTSSTSIVCLQCQMGQSLFNGTCYSCPANFQMNLTSFECQSCPSNCQYCSNGVCTWCVSGYAIDSTEANNSLKCKLINSTVFTTTLTSTTIFQILSKQFPLQQQLIFNNSIQLMSSCQSQLATKFSCLCNSSFTTISSLCYNITTSITNLNLTSVFGATITADIFLKNTDTVRLMAQSPNFDQLTLNIQSVTGASAYFTSDKIASLLEAYTQILRRQSTPTTQLSGNRLLLNTSSVLNQLFNLVSSSFSQTFSLTQTTIIYGNGYYMKYYPAGANIADTDSSFISVNGRNSSSFLFIFVYFDGRNGTSSLTGNIFAYTPLTSYSLTVTIQQTQYPSVSMISYLAYKNSLIDTTVQVTSPSTAVLSFSISTSTLTSQLGYNIQYQQSQLSDINSLYSSQRIEFIFYQPAFIYVLVFLLLYLFLIPCCSLVDFIDGNREHKRKRVRSQDLSVSDEAKQNKMRHDQQSSQSTIQIRINYKDFFPLYNICNTPRPRRILKLCLFLLNTQHSITFLTLIYFNLAPGHPVVAVVLGVPAYFCTIIMGYIFGCFTLLKIPMWLKYSINIVAIGYWILWIALMPRFQSQQYQPYVYIFAIVFFIIDMLIDLLEMFMVYFTIKQSDRQMKMFQCLAAWLSKRGYYEYDQLARDLND